MPLPEPVPGLVVCYSYLWHDESLNGKTEGVKNRPCAVIIVTQDEGKTKVRLAPITHTPPADISVAVELPLATKKRLGLDDEKAWVVCSELNEFYWPGYDLMPVSRKRKDVFDFGVLPPALFKQITTKIGFLARGRQLKVAARGDE